VDIILADCCDSNADMACGVLLAVTLILDRGFGLIPNGRIEGIEMTLHSNISCSSICKRLVIII
jgi:hypothetical protein